MDLEGDSLEDAAILSGLFRAPAIGGGGASRAFVTAASDDPAAGGTIVIEARDGSVRHEIPVGGAAAFGYDPTSTTLAFIAPDEPTDPPAPIPPARCAPSTPTQARCARCSKATCSRSSGPRWADDRNARPAPG